MCESTQEDILAAQSRRPVSRPGNQLPGGIAFSLPNGAAVEDAHRSRHDDDDDDARSVSSELTTVDTSESRLVWTRWKDELLDKLVNASIQQTKRAGGQVYLKATASNVLFPEVENGSLNWVPLARARQLVRMFLLPRSFEEMDRKLRGMAVKGADPQWKVSAVLCVATPSVQCFAGLRNSCHPPTPNPRCGHVPESETAPSHSKAC